LPIVSPKKTTEMHSFNGWDAEGEGNDFTACNAFADRAGCTDQPLAA